MIERITRRACRTLEWVQTHPVWVLISIVSVALALALSWGVCSYWNWLVEVPDGKESGSTTIRNLGLLVFALIALPLAIWRSSVAHRQSVTAQHGLLNERYQKGAEMLGSEALAVRLGGIYALGRLAEQHTEEYHLQIMRLFCAYVRDLPADELTETIRPSPVSPVRIEKSFSFLRSSPSIREDVQAVVTFIGKRSDHGRKLEKSQYPTITIDLSRGALAFAELNGANLAGATLYKVNLSGARLLKANLSSTVLVDARLTGALLGNADISGAQLYLAKMGDAFLDGANLTGSSFSRDGKEPAEGLTQTQLDKARADSANPPDLRGVSNAQTGTSRSKPTRKRTSLTLMAGPDFGSLLIPSRVQISC